MLRLVMSALAGMLLLCAPAQAQFGAEASASKAGFSFPATGQVRILVFRPDVSVGEQSTGGMNEPNAEWTQQARQHLAAALTTAQQERSNELAMMPELEGENATLLADYQGLFRAVANSVVMHKLFAGNRLPTKRQDFNWTLGSGASKLGELGGGDYGLFIYTQDSYGSAGRKALQIFGALMGMGITSGVHIGYAGLVDLRTGELVWVNADVKMGGDVREADGAAKRISQLLEDFPTRASAPAAAAQ
ncbi:MAG TPA: hypothetical protein VM662_16220 [Sphingomonas sp.]|nr:hypothetical protein [Sphingomonas sp.]